MSFNLINTVLVTMIYYEDLLYDCLMRAIVCCVNVVIGFMSRKTARELIFQSLSCFKVFCFLLLVLYIIIIDTASPEDIMLNVSILIS